MGRSPCCEKAGLKKGPWTPEEDQKLLAYIEENGHGSWRALPAKAVIAKLGLQRCGKSCRLRWTNYLRPDIKRGKFSNQEEQTIIQLHALLGNRWSAIATHLPKRTDNEIKNYWNTHLKKRLIKMGIDPVTHKPKGGASVVSGDGQSKSNANLSHVAQWESARLETEARLVRESKLWAPSMPTPLSPQCLPTLQQHQLDHMIRSWQPKSGPQIQVQLQSPALSFLESAMQPNMGYPVDQEGEKLKGHVEDEGLQCFGEPPGLTLDGKDHRSMGGLPSIAAAVFSLDTTNTTVFSAQASRLPESSNNRAAGSSRSSGDFRPAIETGTLFTEMLLDNSGEQDSSERGGAGDSDIAESRRYMEEEEEEAAAEQDDEDKEDKNNNYWNNILDLANLRPSDSPPPMF